MNKLLLSLLLMAAAATFFPKACLAAKAPANALTLKVGAFFPNSQDARTVGGDTQLVLGLDDTLSMTSGTSPSATSVYLDYLGGSKSPTSLHSFGLGVALRSEGTTYFGGGLGIYSTTASVRTDGGTFSKSASGGGGKLFVGFELGGSTQLEFDYHILPSAGGVSPSGVAAEIGIHL